MVKKEDKSDICLWLFKERNPFASHRKKTSWFKIPTNGYCKFILYAVPLSPTKKIFQWQESERKTNLFVDEEYNSRVLSEDNPPVKEETSTSEYLENVTDLDAKSEDTKVFDSSNEDIFNASEETKLKEDKDDL